jgi:mRNA-degrading endonuclease RelE of RelBE toxin-antitoxin system
MKKGSVQGGKSSKHSSNLEFDVRYSKQAEKFFDKHHLLSREEVRAMLVQSVKSLLKIDATSLDIKLLKGVFSGMYHLRKGDIRIIFSFENDEIVIVAVEIIDFRGNVY